MQSLFSEHVLYGVDFSGAVKAGNHLWVTSGKIEKGVLRIVSTTQGKNLPASGLSREECLTALRQFISTNPGVYGLDFPFALHPTQMLGCTEWIDFIHRFSMEFTSPEAFREYCRGVSAKPELKRNCDILSEAPFAPYNLWIYRQTYYGITEVLAPLVGAGKAVALPMMPSTVHTANLLETCPASYLKRHALYQPYKEKKGDSEAGKRARQQREAILEYLETQDVVFSEKATREQILADRYGDAIDSLIATCILFGLFKKPEQFQASLAEEFTLTGYVYF